MLDWWQKREIERILAQELNRAQEKLRVANMQLRDLTDFKQSGIPASDSSLAMKQAHQSCTHAYDEWKIALDRWTNFVKHGTVPEDAGWAIGEAGHQTSSGK